MYDTTTLDVVVGDEADGDDDDGVCMYVCMYDIQSKGLAGRILDLGVCGVVAGLCGVSLSHFIFDG